MTALYGHRGARGEQPENTIEAFEYARSLGIRGIECDVALTRDLVPVLHHDPMLSTGELIRDLDQARLLQLAPDVPALAQALKVVPEMEWLIEIKTFADAPEKSWPPETMAEAVSAVLQNASKLQTACILAFDWRVLSALAQRAPMVRRICLTEPKTERSRHIWWGAEITQAGTPEAVAQANAYGWAPLHSTLTEKQIEQAHLLGLKVFPWTVNEPADLQRLAHSADGIITDFPARALRQVSRPTD